MEPWIEALSKNIFPKQIKQPDNPSRSPISNSPDQSVALFTQIRAQNKDLCACGKKQLLLMAVLGLFPPNRYLFLA